LGSVLRTVGFAPGRASLDLAVAARRIEAALITGWSTARPRRSRSSETRGREGYREVRRLTAPATLALLAFSDVQVTPAEIFA
jgi:hypothetical protein